MTASRAEADLARLQADISRLRAQLADAEARATKIRHYIEMARIYESGEGVAQARTDAPSGDRSRGGAASYIAGVAREILQEHGGPVQTRSLADALTKRGVALGGPASNPVNYLSGVLSRADDFENDRLTGWRLKVWRSQPNREAARVPDPEPPRDDGPPEDGADEPEPSLRVAAE